jgi:hypothetical protein
MLFERLGDKRHAPNHAACPSHNSQQISGRSSDTIHALRSTRVFYLAT